ncbi:MAG: dUTP diphosphatase [Verrucomicrobia bacterium]|nr:dUTP diphosphatase [Verrucomicrobiota bacterium]
MEVPVLVEDPDFVPVYATPLAAGADVKACISEEIVIAPGEKALVPTGVKAAIPEGYEIQVRPRSGLAFNHQITVLNAPGTIDADYRGEIKVILINHGKTAFTVTRGMRIAQIVLAPILQAEFVLEETLTSTTRGEGGFGHTGAH